jgi:phosphatidylglycerophosphatase A
MSPAQRWIALGGGLGRLPQAPGTWGSLGAIPAAWALHALGGFPLFAIATAALFVAGLWAVAAYVADTGVTDPSEVVVDEVIGMWLTLWPLSYGLWHAGLPGWVFPWPGWALGFLLFRFLDIRKPWPVNRAERVPGAFGVMLDDVVAGLIAGVVVLAAGVFAHEVLM